MRIAKANPLRTNAFLIIYPPFSKRWVKMLVNMPYFNKGAAQIARKIMACIKFFFILLSFFRNQPDLLYN
jgi:hypothetical protein